MPLLYTVLLLGIVSTVLWLREVRLHRTTLSRLHTCERHGQQVQALAEEHQQALQRFKAYTQSRDGQRIAFLATVGHELRTPLTVIRGYSEILTRPELLAAGGEDSLFYASAIHDEVLTASRLLETYLDLVRLESGQYRLESDVVDLAEIGREIVSAQPDPYRIQVEITPELPPVWADRQRIGQVLEQMLSYALARTAPARNVALQMSGQNSPERQVAVTVRVLDLGTPLTPQQLEAEFAQIYQLSGHSPKVPGPGLALCRSLAEAQGGRLDFTAMQQTGVTLTLRLPESRPGAERQAGMTSVKSP